MIKIEQQEVKRFYCDVCEKEVEWGRNLCEQHRPYPTKWEVSYPIKTDGKNIYLKLDRYIAPYNRESKTIIIPIPESELLS